MSSRKVRLARLTSNVFNPFLLSFLVIFLVSFHTAPGFGEAVKWSLISGGLSILPVLTIVICLVKGGHLEGIFINARSQRHQIYLLAAACLGLSLVLLRFLGAPDLLVAAFLSGLVSVVVFMVINFKWKISVHTGFISGSVTVLILIYGAAGLLTALLIPLTGWSRIALKRHSTAQVVTGGFVAAAIAFAVFYTSGLHQFYR
ncbi:MAG: phosphatidic acid phosphatase [Chloroflexi bacterium]|nr:phosphatidic acid phosphatase [Chloroflexota bacterium]